MRELLIRYLLGELDANERRDVQARLQDSPELQQELAQLRACFAAHQNEDLEETVPSGLAARTAERVTGCDDASGMLAARREAEFTAAGDPPAGILGWGLADLTVAGGVMLAVSMLIFPALRNSRDGTRRQVCQNSQQQMWVLVTNFAQDHGGLYPWVGPNDPAGIYVARLIAKHYATAEDLAVILVCPGAPLADKIRAGSFVFRLPNAAAIQAMSPSQLAQAAAKMSPCYAYRFPYRVGHDYYNIRDEHRALSPVFADASGDDETNVISPNHGGAVVQVQCENGSNQSLTSRTLPGMNDDFFHNDSGIVAAGMSRLDSVLGNSNVTPGGQLMPQGE